MFIDVEAERSVIGGVLQHGSDGWAEVADLITVNCFNDTKNQLLFVCCGHAIEGGAKELDLPTILRSANELSFDEFKQDGYKKYAKSLTETHVKLSNIRKFAATLKKLHLYKELDRRIDDAKSALKKADGTAPISQVVSSVEQPILEFSTSLTETEELKKIGDGIHEHLSFLLQNKNTGTGISSGYPIYDRAIGGGFRRQSVSIICARPKTGKTMLVGNVSIHNGRKGIPILIMDMEMSVRDHRNRMLSCLSRVELDEIENGRFDQNPVFMANVKRAAIELESLPVTFQSVSGMSTEQIISLMRRWLLKEVGRDKNGRVKDCLIIYDYIRLSDTSQLKNLQEHQAIGFLMSELHTFTQKYDVPILAFCQSNRDGIKDASTAAAALSDRIIWSCSNFSMYQRKTPEEMAEDGGFKNGNRKLIPIISRHGKDWIDGDYINMKFEGEFSTITELNTKNDLRHSLSATEQSEFTTTEDFIPDNSTQGIF